VASRAFVWTGGALFVAALAWCAWWYLLIAGRPRPYHGVAPIAVDALLFSAFALHHSVFASGAVKQRLERVAGTVTRSLYVYAASGLLILVCAAWQPIGGDLYRASRAIAPAHIAGQLAGLWVIARAVARIDPLELAGIRQAAPSGSLQTSGPYRWVRHPLYLGWTIVVFATPHLTGDRLAFAVVSTAYLMIAVPWEERSLVRALGDEYVGYQRAVRWRMIPFIY
jgi:protein-S-isoprenylcysteine O-methyltransferase Ste14